MFLNVQFSGIDSIPLVPDHLNKVNISVKQVTFIFLVLVCIKVMLTVCYSLLSVP